MWYWSAVNFYATLQVIRDETVRLRVLEACHDDWVGAVILDGTGLLTKSQLERPLQRHRRMGEYTSLNCIFVWWNVMQWCTCCISAALKSHIAKVKHREVCQMSKRMFDKPAPSLHPISVSDTWNKLGIDLIELPVSSRGNCYCITLTDYFSKWAEAMPVPTKEAIHADFL